METFFHMNEREELALCLIHAGMATLSEVADAFGLPVSTLHRWARQAGIDPKAQRAAYLRKWISIGMAREWRLPRKYVAGIRYGRTRRKHPKP